MLNRNRTIDQAIARREGECVPLHVIGEIDAAKIMMERRSTFLGGNICCSRKPVFYVKDIF